MKKLFTAKSTNKDTKKAVEELYLLFNKNNEVCSGLIKYIIFFSSTSYSPDDLINEFNTFFPNVTVFGCSTAGEISDNYFNTGSLVAMGFTNEVFEDICIEVLDLKNYQEEIKQSIKNIEKYYDSPINQLDRKKYFGLLLMDGLSSMEEKILDLFGEYSNIEFTGGSAGDDLHFKQTICFANGKAKNSSAIIAIIKSKNNFAIESHHHFNLTDKQLIATNVDVPNRIIYEFDGQPALQRYCKLLNISVDKAPLYFLSNPIGLNIDGKIFVRSIQKVHDNGTALHMYCNVSDGTTLTLLNAGNIIENTSNIIKKIKST